MPHHTTSQAIPTRICSECREEKSATTEYFGRHKGSPDGLRARCKECRKIETRERYTADPEYNHKYYIANTERIKENVRAYRAANRERVAEKDRNYRQNNKERVREVKRAAVLRRLARKHNAPGNHTAEDVKAQHNRQKGKCYYCGEKVGDSYHVDHVIPLSRGGSNGPENIVIACPTCNLSKSDKLPHEWPKGGRLL